MSEDVQGFRFRATPRVPFRREVRLRFDRIGGSVSGTTADISTEGMFVATGEYKPIGTLVQFEFENDAGETVQGLADIVWIREVGQGADREPGMGLHFRYVDPRSRELIAGTVRDLLAEKEEREDVVPKAPAPRPPPTAGMAPGDDTEPSIVWSEPDSAPVAFVPPSQPEPLEPLEPLEQPDLDAVALVEPGRPGGRAIEIPEVETPETLAPETETMDDAPAAGGGAANVWTGSDEWLRPEREAEDEQLPATRGAAIKRRSRVPMLVAALLLVLALAAGLAYYRWQVRAGSADPGWSSSAEPESSSQTGDSSSQAGDVEGLGSGDGSGVEPGTEAAASGAQTEIPVGAEVANGADPMQAAPSESRGPVGAASVGGGAGSPSTENGEDLVPVAEPAPRGGALRLTSVTSDAATVVRIAAPWELRDGSIQSFRLDAPPRFVVRVRGAQEALPATVDSSHLQRIRIGAHTGAGASEPEIHFVFDLTAATVRTQVAVVGGVVVVTFAD
ncbi:MAG TPA: PilZ domain-containing protein [Thermoanaerobaculia bacterium]|nr:PilZ domain-containing protein [Thermoanaerobaculia bacterium]